MKHLNWRIILAITLGLSIPIWLLLLLIKGITPGFSIEALNNLPTVLTIEMAIWGLFVTVLWKFPVFQKWLVPFPNLNGTWKGNIESTWIDPDTNEQIAPKNTILVIRQSFLTISCTLHTDEIISTSYTADFVIDKDSGQKKLVYSYIGKPLATVRDRSAIHDGTGLFRVVEKPTRKLVGEYWTSRNSTGVISLEFWKKEHLDAFPVSLSDDIS